MTKFKKIVDKCSIKDCENKHYAKGLCKKHYDIKWNEEHPGYRKQHWKLYYIKNGEEIRERARSLSKGYYVTHREKKIEYWRLYREGNKDKINKYYVGRKESDINFRLGCALRSRLSIALKRNIKTGSAVNDLGCSLDFFREYLESLWSPGMNWENYGIGDGKWNIDHTKPLSKFNLVDRDEFLEACHYTNLKPMWCIENIRKGGKYLQKCLIGESPFVAKDLELTILKGGKSATTEQQDREPGKSS